MPTPSRALLRPRARRASALLGAFAVSALVACSGSDSSTVSTATAEGETGPTAQVSRAEIIDAQVEVAEEGSGVSDKGPHTVGDDCTIFPKNHFWHAVVSDLPTHEASDRYLEALRGTSGDGIHIVAASQPWEGSFGGLPLNFVGHDTKITDTAVVYREQRRGAGGRRDPKSIPLPPNFRYEGYPAPTGAWDRHILVVDTRTCTGYELFNADLLVHRLTGTLLADGGAVWNLRSTEGPIDTASGNLTPIGTNVSRVPIIGGTTTYDEVMSGRVDHGFHLCVTGASKEVVWPARWSDGKGTSPDAPPMGSWFRLRRDFDISGYGDQVKVVLQAMKIHGLLLTDSCATEARASMDPDPRWDAKQWRNLRLPWSSFEVVDTSGIAVDPANTFEIR